MKLTDFSTKHCSTELFFKNVIDEIEAVLSEFCDCEYRDKSVLTGFFPGFQDSDALIEEITF